MTDQERKRRGVVGFYLLDVNPESTSSPGIQRYSCRLVAALDACPPRPGLGVEVWVPTVARHLLPSDRELHWVSVRTVAGCYGTGVARLWADHFLSRRLARQVSAVHFPKGWIPVPALRRTPVIATVCDAIPLWYRQQVPSHAPTRMRYFSAMIRHALRRADRIITISAASAAALTAIRPGRAVTVIPAGGMDAPPDLSPRDRDGVVILASPHPHKRTAETLHLLNRYAARRGRVLPVTLVGPVTEPLRCAAATCDRLAVRVAGRVPDAGRDALLKAAECLVFLSEIEGFGLPLLESYACGTPVCYRATGAACELLGEAPGGWDGRSEEGFFAALDAVRAMGASEIGVVARALHARYRWPLIAERTLDVYAALLGGPPVPDTMTGGEGAI